MTCAAIDLGASSARLIAGEVVDDRLVVHEVARLANQPVRLPDGLHWNLLGLHHGMLEALAALARRSEGRLRVGIDGWGVDYGLLDGDGRLLGPPYHYRDRRTEGRIAQADALVGRRSLYEATGIQEMAINTVFQLLAERESPAYQAATQLLLIPDLLGYFFSGQRVFELTNASTTQLVDARSRKLAPSVLSSLGVRAELFAPLVEPGEELGGFLPEVASSVELSPLPTLVGVASHDTASAVLAVPAGDGDFAYVVSGTWSLVGLELGSPVIGEESWRANFSNELGFGGTVRFLKNVMGHWMIQECQRTWACRDVAPTLPELVAQAAACPPFRSLVDTADPRFAAPGDLPEAVRAACAERGEPVPASDGELVRCVLDSIALDVAAALEQAQRLARRQVRVVHVVGGGAENTLLCSLIAAASGIEVLAGPTEASAIGNLLVQLQGTTLHGVEESRSLVRRSFPILRYDPDPGLAEAAGRARRRLTGGSTSTATRPAALTRK